MKKETGRRKLHNVVSGLLMCCSGLLRSNNGGTADCDPSYGDYRSKA